MKSSASGLKLPVALAGGSCFTGPGGVYCRQDTAFASLQNNTSKNSPQDREHPKTRLFIESRILTCISGVLREGLKQGTCSAELHAAEALRTRLPGKEAVPFCKCCSKGARRSRNIFFTASAATCSHHSLQ